MEILYNKLVRDNISEIIKQNGEIPVIRILNDKEYWEYLQKKDQEELEEVKSAKSIKQIKEELSDKLEIIRAMAEYNGFSLEDIIDEANRKKAKNGGFKKRVLLEKVLSNKNKI